MSKYVYRLLVSIMMLGLGGVTHAAFGQCLCDPCTPSATGVDPVILERDDFNAPADGSLQQIVAPTVPGTCLSVVGAIREGLLTDDDPTVMSPLPDIDIYQFVVAAPIAPTTFTLTLAHNPENRFRLVVADAVTGRPIRDCSIELDACVVRVSRNVNLTITGVFAGVYILSIIHGL